MKSRIRGDQPFRSPLIKTWTCWERQEEDLERTVWGSKGQRGRDTIWIRGCWCGETTGKARRKPRKWPRLWASFHSSQSTPPVLPCLSNESKPTVLLQALCAPSPKALEKEQVPIGPCAPDFTMIRWTPGYKLANNTSDSCRSLWTLTPKWLSAVYLFHNLPGLHAMQPDGLLWNFLKKDNIGSVVAWESYDDSYRAHKRGRVKWLCIHPFCFFCFT